MTIRVLQVITQMNRGGLETRLMDLYRTTDRDLVQYDFLTFRPEPGTYDSEIVALGGRVFYGEPLSLWPPTAVPRRLELFLQDHCEFQIVHAHMNSWCGPILQGAKNAGVVHRIAHSRGADQSGGIPGRVKRGLRPWTRVVASHRLAVSRTAGSWLFGEKAMSSGAVTVVPNAVDIDSLRFNAKVRLQMRTSLGLGSDPVLIHVGNLNPVKNHTFLLLVFADILRRAPDAWLLLIGDGAQREKLVAQSVNLGIAERVRFLGSRNDVPALLQAADVMVFPSLHEGMPGAVLEAQATGLPCVISETIDPAARVLSTTRSIGLSESAGTWADAVLEAHAGDRGAASHLMRRAGYDVESVSAFMSEMYLSMHNERT